MSLSDFGFVSGTFAVGQTQVVVQMPASTSTPNVSATLMSADAARAIELCTNGAGSEYFTADYDAESAAMLVLATRSPVTHIRFTGAAGDTYRVQA